MNRELSETKAMVSRLRGEVEEKERAMKEKDRAVVQLRRELIDVDSQLDSERRRHAAALRADRSKGELESDRHHDHDKGISSDKGISNKHKVVIPSVSHEYAPRPPPPRGDSDDASGALSETFTNRSPPPRSRPVGKTHPGASQLDADRRHLSPHAHSIGGSPPRKASPSKGTTNTASYAATTASFRSGRYVPSDDAAAATRGARDTESGQGAAPATTSGDTNSRNSSSRMRTVKASSSMTAASSSSVSYSRNADTSELFDREGAQYGRVEGAGGRRRVPEWRSVDPQTTSADISPVAPRRRASHTKK